MTFRPLAAVAPVFLALTVLLALFAAPAARAQVGEVWLQVEAQPDLATAEVRAADYGARFPETSGFRLRSGWYGIMLGPYSAAEAEARLASLKRERLIPSDSFIAFSRDFGDRYWPAAGAPAPVVVEDPAVAPPPAASEAPEETLSQARASEAALTEDDRKALQTALQWFGHYAGAIDGAFGPGTRRSMAAWQAAEGLDATGTLTARQRAALLEAYATETAAFGFAPVTDPESGITVTLPLGLVAFDHYEPPFVHYRPVDPMAPGIVLISQPGDEAALAALYDLLQTLDAVPVEGERALKDRSFRITGLSDRASTTAFAELKGGLIKGWMLMSTPGNETRDARILQQLETSFASDGRRALDPGMVPMGAETRAGLLAGLELRKPRLSRSGLYVDGAGKVLTTVEAVDGCARITLDETTEARLAASDASKGLALLLPVAPLAPRGVAALQDGAPRIGSEVMVAGYSYEDRLPAPVITFGALEDLTGLNGEPGLTRLAIETLPGDAGGPVLDGTGAVIGMLLPAAADGARQLPAGVAFAASAGEIAAFLGANGVSALPAETNGALPPADLAATGSAMTVLVSCWD